MKRVIMSQAYARILKPILFRFDPELVHDGFTQMGRLLSKSQLTREMTRWAFSYQSKRLEQRIGGQVFVNPIGLSAGFDYDGYMSGVMPSVGFGFESMGTVTRSSYEGNAKPRLGRLPESKSLLVNKGFKSAGIEYVLTKNVRFVDDRFRLGISIGATNSSATSTPETQIEDILSSVLYWKEHTTHDSFAYLEINISCPNVLGAGSLATPGYLKTLLKKVVELDPGKPIWIKYPIEIEFDESDVLMKVMVDHGVEAVVIGNLLKKRDSNKFVAGELDKHLQHKGNFSGKPTWDLSNRLIEHTYNRFGNELKIVGVGGVFSAEDAYKKIRLGATLVELITGMVYEGPQVIGGINEGLVRLMDRDGFSTIDEVVGVGIR